MKVLQLFDEFSQRESGKKKKLSLITAEGVAGKGEGMGGNGEKKEE